MNINLFSLVGLVLLIGLVTKNSILLVEYANQQVAKGTEPREAIIQAGIVRLRPILMTAFATVAGILPIAVGFGAGPRSPTISNSSQWQGTRRNVAAISPPTDLSR